MPMVKIPCCMCSRCGTIHIVDPIIRQIIKSDTCPLCNGAGVFKIYLSYEDNIDTLDWRKNNKGSK